MLWEEPERTRTKILASIDLAEASLAQGEGRIITRQSMRELAGEAKQAARLGTHQIHQSKHPQPILGC